MTTKDIVKIDIEWGHERLVRAQQTVELRPFDIESWSILLREAQGRHVNEMRSLYESLVNVFPTTAKYWKIFIEQEMKFRNFERVEKLFQRCLVKILNIELWKLYLAYVKETKAGLATHKEKLAQAYDFALEKIGMDLHSFSIWQEYIQFLKSVEAVGSYAENQKITAVRKVYQEAVVTPIIGIETLWKEYIAFEYNINPIISEKMSLERSKAGVRASKMQISIMKDFMEKHDGLAKGKLLCTPEGRTKANLLWEKLKNELNINGPPVKSVGDWKRFWAVRKCRVRQKLTNNKKSLSKTGGGKYEDYSLNPDDEDMAAVCGLENACEGIPGARSFGENNSEVSTLIEEAILNTEDAMSNVEETTQINNSSLPLSSETIRPKKINKTELFQSQLQFNSNLLSEMVELKNAVVELKDLIKLIANNMARDRSDEARINLSLIKLKTKELEVMQQTNNIKIIKLLKKIPK